MEKMTGLHSTKISIVICTMNRPKDLKICLNSIARQTYLPSEVILVDASHDNSSKKIFMECKSINPFKIQYIKTEPGLTRQRNLGLTKAKGEIIGFLDDDVILEKRYLSKIVLCFENDSHVYGATGNIVNLPKIQKLESLYYKVFMLHSHENSGSLSKAGSPNFLNSYIAKSSRNTRILSGCNMFYKKEIFKNFIFDEYFEGYSLMEDAEFSYRISRKYKLMYIYDAKLVHEHSPSQRINLAKYFEMTVLNQNFVFKKLVKKSNFDWFFYWWSNVGVMFISLRWTIKGKSINPLVGLMKGYLGLAQK